MTMEENAKMQPCLSCGSYEIDANTQLCDKCAEDMGIIEEEYDDDDSEIG